MVKQKEVLAIIPARGGSKGIPRKNIRDFAGHPLIAYSIAAGIKAESVTRVIVSTDDERIAEISRKYEAETPFLRPAELAQDDTTDLPVFQHALAWLAEHEGYAPEVVVQLRPTSPVRSVGLVDEAVRILLDHPEVDSVRGVVPASQNPHKMWRIDAKSGRMKNLLDVPGLAEPYNAPRQMLPPVYWQTGHVDAIRAGTILEQKSMSGKVILPVMIDPRYMVDIDNLLDWQRAEWLVYNGGLEMVHPCKARRPLPQKTVLVVFDFDGVMTDNRVWVDASGHEYVAAYRSDSLGIHALQRSGVEVIVISTETDRAVTARCRKIGIPLIQDALDKAAILTNYLDEKQIDARQVVYCGNDLNDLPCFPIVGCAVVPADAQAEVIRAADLVLNRPGGYGAVRELCELILRRNAASKSDD